LSTTRVAGKGGSGDGSGPTLLAEISRRPALAIGFRNLLSDVVWLQAVQAAGNKRMTRANYDRVYSLVGTVANFDAKFKIAYLIGGLVLTESPDHSRDAIRLFERGRANFPEEWRFPFYIGYTRYFSLGDAAEAGRSMMEAARLPESPAYLPRLAARMLSEGRDPETALSFLREMIDQETDATRREILIRRAREVAIERDLQGLERAVESYRAARGRNPATLEELVLERFLRAIPAEPNGGQYRLARDGKVYSTTTRERLRVLRGNN
jgi:tetratricopeptide (TPR) repeat protein